MYGVLSQQARSLWAKTDRGAGVSWLPLYIHLHDSVGIAEHLWDSWLPAGTKQTIARFVEGDLTLARKAYLFLAGVHDLGKATPVFQAKPIAYGGGANESLSWRPERAGLFIRPELAGLRRPLHAVAGQVLLEKYLTEHDWESKPASSFASVVGSHHGSFPGDFDVCNARLLQTELGLSGDGANDWTKVRIELIDSVLAASGIESDDLRELGSHVLPAPIGSLLDGLVIMADWMSSNEDAFPLIDLCSDDLSMISNDPYDAERLRVEKAWGDLRITPSWKEPGVPQSADGSLIIDRFELPRSVVPHPIQQKAIEIALGNTAPGFMVIEAPMGEGKTEAALAAAEIMAVRHGCGGVCVALPTMATTDAMFQRVHGWLGHLPHCDRSDKSVYLAHGKARLNDEFQGIVMRSRTPRLNVDAWERTSRSASDKHRLNYSWEDESTFASDWMFGRKRGLLSNFVVCTVDQVLMGALDMRHLSIRHVALANKVVVIDECHAYDSYMQEYLCRVLEWLGYWRTPVILLSATLPQAQRDGMAKSYLKGRKASFGRTCSDDSGVGASENSRASWRNKIGRKPNQGDGKAAQFVSVGPVPGSAYPLITFSTGDDLRYEGCDSCGKRTEVRLTLIDEKDEPVGDLLSRLLSEGGCAGVICDTVARAQQMAECLSSAFSEDVVILDHSRFVDSDRMSIEAKIRNLLGPRSTVENGRRPRMVVVVGTQVLEQSLDIDFDVLVTDVAPIDLLLQRLGRMHRHVRGEGESSRPYVLRVPQCFVTGVTSWEPEPKFEPGISNVYSPASLIESLAVLGLGQERRSTTVSIPEDVSSLVRLAYSDDIESSIPDEWKPAWRVECKKRREVRGAKARRAGQCLIRSAETLQRNRYSLTKMAPTHSTRPLESDPDAGNRAVRDSQESLEVLLLRRVGDGLALLPWIGDEEHDVPLGSSVPIDSVPAPCLAKVVLQSAVRLPLSICKASEMEFLIEELEEGCAQYVGSWQESPWLAGRLVLPVVESRGQYLAQIHGRGVVYTARGGLTYDKDDVLHEI